MPTGIYKTVKQRIAAAAARQGTTRTPTPEPATASGVTPGNALFDTPPRRSRLPRRSQSPRVRSGRRTSRSTQRGDWYTADLHERRVHGELSVQGRRRKAAQRACSASCKSNGNDTDMQTNVDGLQTDAGEYRTNADELWTDVDGTGHTQVDAGNTDTQADSDNLPATTDSAPPKAPARRRGRKSKPKSITISKPQPERPRNTRKCDRSPSRSPTPGSTDVDPAELDFVTGKTQAGSQHIYVYETVDHPTLLRIAEKKLGENMDGHSTQEILERLRVTAKAKTPALATKRYNTSIVLLSPAPIGVGGGWRYSQLPSLAPAASSSRPAVSLSAKRASDALDGPACKRARIDQVENTNTESESDKEVIARPHAPLTAAPTLDPRPNLQPLQPQQSQGTQPPPPSHDHTPATVLRSQPPAQPSCSHSLGSSLSHYSGPPPPLPRLFTPVPGPVHARLRASVLECFVDRMEAEARDDEMGDEEMDELDMSNPSQRVSIDELDEFDEPNASTSARPGLSNPINRNKKTYGTTRTHLPPDPNALATAASPPA